MIKPFIFTLFGSTGDLAQKKIMPALLKLYGEGRFESAFTVIAFSRRAWNNEQYHAFIRPSLEGKAHTEQIDSFLKHVVYVAGHFDEEAAYQKINTTIEAIEKTNSDTQKLFYLSVQPEFFENILQGLSGAHLLKDASSRILIEKPFGRDVASAQELEQKLEHDIPTERIFRIDHYLAKEGFRKMSEEKRNNVALEQKLNAAHVQSIHARIFETIGIEGRGDFYETTGAVRDIGQNHLLEMLAAAMMNASNNNENAARAEVIKSLTVKDVPVFGQYEGYHNEPEVNSQSKTETYFYVNAESSLDRWKGIPLTLEGGKAMAEKRADVTVTFKDGTQKVFDVQASLSGRDAYEVLIEQAIVGQQAYFASFEEIYASWIFVEQIFKKHDTVEVQNYSKGINGPKS